MKNLKIIGEIILVLSFLTQTLLFDYYDEKSSGLESAAQSRSLMDKGAELKELKYFLAEIPDDSVSNLQYKRLNINMAAQKLAQSELMQIIGSEKSKKEKTDLANNILIQAQKVESFYDYTQFIKYINENSIPSKDIIDNIENINSNKTLWRKVFIFLYILGTTLMIISIFIENKTSKKS